MEAEDPGRYCLAASAMSSGNAVRLLRDGREAYPAMLDAIAGAGRSVHLETYILRADRTGRRFAEALAAAARRGARVRLLFDAVGSLGMDRGFLAGLAGAGVGVHEYHPLRPRSLLGGFHRRDHRKVLVVDARVGFAGGINLGDEYAPRQEGGGGWRDNHLRVEGPAAAGLDAEFLRLWRRQARETVPAGGGQAAGAGTARVRVLANRNLLHRHRIRAAYLHALKAARRSVEIANAYFIPDRGIRRALRRAAERGVSVRILVPERSDVPLADAASRRLYGGLLASGCRLFQYTGGILHCKTVVVDRLWSAVGSYNMDHRSLFHNLELNLHVVDPGLGEALAAAFEDDLANAREVRAETWRLRPLGERLRERLAYALRYWL